MVNIRIAKPIQAQQGGKVHGLTASEVGLASSAKEFMAKSGVHH